MGSAIIKLGYCARCGASINGNTGFVCDHGREWCLGCGCRCQPAPAGPGGGGGG